MSRIELRRKTIDPLTGSDVIEKRVFKLAADADPTMSVVFHKTADLLGIKTFDRANPHVYRKLAVLYNWAAEKAKSNDANKVFDILDAYRAKLGVSVLGLELVDTLYRKVRLEVDRSEELAEREAQRRGIAGINKELREDAKRTSEIKGEQRKGQEVQGMLDARAGDKEQITVQAWKDSLIKDRNIKIKVISDTHLEERKEV